MKRGSSLLNEDRRKSIYQLVRAQGSVRVVTLCERLNTSEMTIRRDLAQMANEGLLRRVHGGAVAVDVADERSFQSRQVEELPRKQAIAALACEMIPRDATIFVDASTTCHELIKLLPTGYGLRVVTTSFAALCALRHREGIEMTALGGTLEAETNTLDGPLAMDAAANLSVDLCFFSAHSFDDEGVYNPGPVGTQVKKIMIQNATRVVLLADSSKLGHKGFLKLCDWTVIDGLITNSLPPEQLEPIRQQDVEVQLAVVESYEGAY